MRRLYHCFHLAAHGHQGDGRPDSPLWQAEARQQRQQVILVVMFK